MRCSQPFRTHELALTWEHGDGVEEQVVCMKRACDPCVEAYRAADTEARRSEEQATVLERWHRAGLTERMFRQTIGSFDRSRLLARSDGSTALEDATWLLDHAHDETPAWLVLWGPRGVGKTHMATGILLEVCRRGGYAAWRTGKEMLDELRATHEPGSRTTEAALQREWARLALLVIDDVGVDRQTPYTAEAYWAVLDGRYRSGLPLVMTTNLTPDLLRAHIGEAAASRISEYALMSEVVASDYRVGMRQRSLHLVADEPDDAPF